MARPHYRHRFFGEAHAGHTRIGNVGGLIHRVDKTSCRDTVIPESIPERQARMSFETMHVAGNMWLSGGALPNPVEADDQTGNIKRLWNIWRLRLQYSCS